ncbi:MAG: hypothetical protein QXZ68_04710 [Candidatus Bathyarchaeia archaeon]
MFKHEIYFYDETERTVEEADFWVPIKQVEITKDAYNYHFINLKFTLSLKCPIGKSGEAAIFINDEENPRLTIKYDKPFQDYVIKEINVYDLNFGKHKLTLALKGSITNIQFKIEVLRFYTMVELLADLVPIMLLAPIFALK